MNRKMTCILCPNGCKLRLEVSGNEILILSGAKCPRGTIFAEQELTDPHRNIATSVLVEEGELPLVSVRLTKPIPKGEILSVVDVIKALYVKAPVSSGQVLIENVLGLGVDVICTKNIHKNS